MVTSCIERSDWGSKRSHGAEQRQIKVQRGLESPAEQPKRGTEKKIFSSAAAWTFERRGEEKARGNAYDTRGKAAAQRNSERNRGSLKNGPRRKAKER